MKVVPSPIERVLATLIATVVDNVVAGPESEILLKREPVVPPIV